MCIAISLFFLECHISKCMCVRLHLDVKIGLENSCHHESLSFAALDKSTRVINRHVQVQTIQGGVVPESRYLSLQVATYISIVHIIKIEFVREASAFLFMMTLIWLLYRKQYCMNFDHASFCEVKAPCFLMQASCGLVALPES